jgi:hypothetical protein
MASHLSSSVVLHSARLTLSEHRCGVTLGKERSQEFLASRACSLVMSGNSRDECEALISSFPAEDVGMF